MNTSLITFTPGAITHISSFITESSAPLHLSRSWNLELTAPDGRAIIRDLGVSLTISHLPITEGDIPVQAGKHIVYFNENDFIALRGQTIYLSTGHSLDTSFDSGILLKIAEQGAAANP